ncbi:MAG: hypothetical protein V1880_01630 [Patescibacteria group bacterium]
MTSQTLLDQFFGLLAASNSFQLLSPEEQAAIKTNYQNASDEQLNQAIQTLREDQIASEKLAAEAKQMQEEVEKNVAQMKITLREIKKDELKKQEAVAVAEDEQKGKALLQEIETMKDPQKKEAPKKRKKFLGIF